MELQGNRVQVLNGISVRAPPAALLSLSWLHSQAGVPDAVTMMITSSSRLIYYLFS